MKIFFFKSLLYNNLNPWIKREREREKTLKLHHLLQFNAWHSYESDLYFVVYVYFSCVCMCISAGPTKQSEAADTSLAQRPCPSCGGVSCA